jgi:hypothetical protein
VTTKAKRTSLVQERAKVTLEMTECRLRGENRWDHFENEVRKLQLSAMHRLLERLRCQPLLGEFDDGMQRAELAYLLDDPES